MKNFDDQKFVNELESALGIYILFCCRSKSREVLDEHVPIQNKEIRSKKLPWITSKIKKLIITRNKKEKPS